MVLTDENILRRMEHWDFIRRVDPYRLKNSAARSPSRGGRTLSLAYQASRRIRPLFYIPCTTADGATPRVFNGDRHSGHPLAATCDGGDVLVLNNATYHRGREASDFRRLHVERSPHLPSLPPAALTRAESSQTAIESSHAAIEACPPYGLVWISLRPDRS